MKAIILLAIILGIGYGCQEWIRGFLHQTKVDVQEGLPVPNAAAPDPAAWLKVSECSLARNNVGVLEEAAKSGRQVRDLGMGGPHERLLDKPQMDEMLSKTQKFLAEECDKIGR